MKARQKAIPRFRAHRGQHSAHPFIRMGPIAVFWYPTRITCLINWMQMFVSGGRKSCPRTTKGKKMHLKQKASAFFSWGLFWMLCSSCDVLSTMFWWPLEASYMWNHIKKSFLAQLQWRHQFKLFIIGIHPRLGHYVLTLWQMLVTLFLWSCFTWVLFCFVRSSNSFCNRLTRRFSTLLHLNFSMLVLVIAWFCWDI